MATSSDTPEIFNWETDTPLSERKPQMATTEHQFRYNLRDAAAAIVLATRNRALLTHDRRAIEIWPPERKGISGTVRTAIDGGMQKIETIPLSNPRAEITLKAAQSIIHITDDKGLNISFTAYRQREAAKHFADSVNNTRRY